jgi:hypothetical protein
MTQAKRETFQIQIREHETPAALLASRALDSGRLIWGFEFVGTAAGADRLIEHLTRSLNGFRCSSADP